MSNNIQQKKSPTFSAIASSPTFQKKMLATLTDPKRVQRFTTSIITTVTNNPKLQECEPMSLISSALIAESLNLSVNPQLGQFYLVPFKDNKKGTSKATPIIGYKGFVQLAIRSGYYSDLDVLEIKQGEFIGRDKFTGKRKFEFIEDEDLRLQTPTVGYLAYFEYENGFKKSVYWSKEEVLYHADKHSAAFSKEATNGRYPKVSFEDYQKGMYSKSDEWLYSSQWYTNFDDMANKTVLKHLISRWGIMSVDMQKAFEQDIEIQNNDDSDIIDEANIIDEKSDIANEVDVKNVVDEIPQPEEVNINDL